MVLKETKYQWLNTHEDMRTKAAVEFRDLLKRHFFGIINYITFPISNASSEGMNSIIQSLRRVARGLPNFHNFRARTLFHLGKLETDPV